MPDGLFRPLRPAADWFAARPVRLWLTLVALNAVAVPYAGLTHDAVLYAAQAVNRADGGRLANDLFFRYGSQDRYSAFSRAAGPLVRAVGLEPAFLLLYLAGAGLFAAAAVRVVRAVVPDPAAGLAGLVLVAVAPVAFAGLDTLHVNEPFTTPRLFANALVLLALDALLARRWAAAGLFLAAGMGTHPLMAVGGVAVGGVWAVRRAAGDRAAAVAVALAAAAVGWTLADRDLGTRLYKEMDPEWFEMIRAANPFNVPSEWAAADWVRVGAAAAVWALAVAAHPDREARALVFVVGGVSLAGLGGAVLACQLPYALPIQGQPYRLLWMVQFLAVPLGVWAADRWWAAGTPTARLLAAGLLAAVLWRPTAAAPPAVWAAATVVGLVAARGLGPAARRPDWAAVGVLAGLLLAGVAWLAVQVAWLAGSFSLSSFDPVGLVAALPRLAAGPPAWALGLVAVAAAARGWAAAPRLTAAGLAAVAVALPAALALVPTLGWYAEKHRAFVGDGRFVHAVVTAGGEAGRSPTVFWPVDRAGIVWFHAESDSYFEYAQIGGNLFHRPNAVEIRRRAAVVAPFERYAFYRVQVYLDDRERRVVEALFGGPATPTPPTAADLRRVAADPLVDWVVLDADFPEFERATNGRVYVYDARKLRE